MKNAEVKICGLTNLDDARAALDYGADYIGFVLYPGSPRAITPAQVVRILDKLDRPARAIGLFVNSSRVEVEVLAGDCGFYAIQLHGDEAAADFADFDVPIWRAVKFSGKNIVPRPEEWPVARYLVDSNVPGKYGGTGEMADWKTAAKFATKHPIMLAGGLTPENVADALNIVKPLGVDVSSGVESEPGRKDHSRMRAFLDAAKA